MKFLPYMLVVILYYIGIDVFNQNLLDSTGNYNTIQATIFNFVWIGFFIIILYMLKEKPRKYVGLVFNILILIFSIVNYFMYSYFMSVFSWKDIILSGDGFTFISSIFKFINFKIILFVLLGIVFNVIITILCKGDFYRIKSKQTLVIIPIIIILLLIYNNTIKSLSNTSDGWDSTEVLNNKSNYYTNWIEPNKLIEISGTYEYIFRDFYMSFFRKENLNETKNTIINYINNSEEIAENEYTGIFKDKNLVLVMMESMDDWLISEEVTPTIHYMMQHGFNFNNHYSPAYVSGPTANTEFLANTGIYPNINYLSPNYAYNKNTYSYSLPNLFKNSGYLVNSFHRSFGHVYNREEMHMSFGYEKYHPYNLMGIADENLDLDSYIAINGYEKIVKDDRFMSFIITYSGHSPYQYSKIESANNLEEIQKLDIAQSLNEEEISALSAARETDNMFKILLEKLRADDKLKDTVIVAFADHPNNVYLSEEENSTLNKTTFFIYSEGMESNQIETLTSSINILPTVKNLFALNSNFVYPGYDALNTEEEYVVFKDYTYYDGNEIKSITEDIKNDLEYSKALLVSDYYKE